MSWVRAVVGIVMGQGIGKWLGIGSGTGRAAVNVIAKDRLHTGICRKGQPKNFGYYDDTLVRRIKIDGSMDVWIVSTSGYLRPRRWLGARNGNTVFTRVSMHKIPCGNSYHCMLCKKNIKYERTASRMAAVRFFCMMKGFLEKLFWLKDSI